MMNPEKINLRPHEKRVWKAVKYSPGLYRMGQHSRRLEATEVNDLIEKHEYLRSVSGSWS